jgi:AT-rich interactive domain-containing protein 1
MHPPMGPPHHMGPPMGPTSMGPPQNALGAGGPTVNSSGHPPSEGQTPPHIEGGPQDNGISSSGSGGPPTPHPVTSIVTTGPDGQPMDEASQHSTLSNTSVGKHSNGSRLQSFSNEEMAKKL